MRLNELKSDTGMPGMLVPEMYAVSVLINCVTCTGQQAESRHSETTPRRHEPSPRKEAGACQKETPRRGAVAAPRGLAPERARRRCQLQVSTNYMLRQTLFKPTMLLIMKSFLVNRGGVGNPRRIDKPPIFAIIIHN